MHMRRMYIMSHCAVLLMLCVLLFAGGTWCRPTVDPTSHMGGNGECVRQGCMSAFIYARVYDVSTHMCTRVHMFMHTLPWHMCVWCVHIHIHFHTSVARVCIVSARTCSTHFCDTRVCIISGHTSVTHERVCMCKHMFIHTLLWYLCVFVLSTTITTHVYSITMSGWCL